jgi:hypothetical protein
MSANFHGGIELFNYVWDYTYTNHPDKQWWLMIGNEYASSAQSNSPSGYFTAYQSGFDAPGITNGATWYVVEGSMQDYMHNNRFCRESTIELSNTKNPSSSTLPNYWNYNYQAMLAYMEQVLYGFKGLVTDAFSNSPIVAKIELIGHDAMNSHVFSSLPIGNYHRPVKAGTYTIVASAPGYISQQYSNVSITDYNTVVRNFQLMPESPDTELVADPVQLDFGYVGSGNSAEMSYQLSGTLLGNGPVNITAPSGYQVSLTSGSGFASSINVSYTPPTLGAITVYVRFAPTGSPAIYNGVISNVGGGASTDVQLSGNSILSYCSSTATNTSDEWITNVAFAGINNSSGSTGYSDFTNLSPAEVIPGNDYTLSASLGMTGTWSEYFVAWIDWNQNGVFESAESYQIGNCNSNGCTVSTTISVPSGAALGTTVMRVVMQYSSYRTDPCGTFTYGEVEDYALNVISGISCNDFEETTNAQICEGSTYSWRGNNYSVSGTYHDSLFTTNPPGCDSVYILNLTVNPVFEFVSNAEICEGDTYQWQGGNYTVGGTYTETYQTVNGCDSVYILNLTVNPVYEFVSNAEICEGDTYQWQGGNYTVGGTYTETYQTVDGCDSVYILNLIVNPVFEFVSNAEICEGDTYQWQGGNYTVGGTYTETYQTVNGCDSVYILNLTVNPVYEFVSNAEICEGDTYQWQGGNYTVGGTYTETYQTVDGCDSVYILNLIVNPVFEFVNNAEICEGDTYQWQGGNYTVGGTYTETYQTVNGATVLYPEPDREPVLNL